MSGIFESIVQIGCLLMAKGISANWDWNEKYANSNLLKKRDAEMPFVLLSVKRVDTDFPLSSTQVFCLRGSHRVEFLVHFLFSFYYCSNYKCQSISVGILACHC